MAWETRRRGGRYYTRSRRENGRVVREYVGTGERAALAAATDAVRRWQRQVQRDARRELLDELRELDALADELDAFADLLARAALLAAGYHQHARGSWRRRHVGNHTDHGDARTRTG